MLVTFYFDSEDIKSLEFIYSTLEKMTLKTKLQNNDIYKAAELSSRLYLDAKVQSDTKKNGCMGCPADTMHIIKLNNNQFKMLEWAVHYVLALFTKMYDSLQNDNGSAAALILTKSIVCALEDLDSAIKSKEDYIHKLQREFDIKKFEKDLKQKFKNFSGNNNGSVKSTTPEETAEIIESLKRNCL